MCVMSMVMDHYRDKWSQLNYQYPIVNPLPGPSKDEFDKLRADVDEMLALLKRAKIYDKENNQADCESAEKMEILRGVAKLMGIDLDKAIKEMPA